MGILPAPLPTYYVCEGVVGCMCIFPKFSRQLASAPQTPGICLTSWRAAVASSHVPPTHCPVQSRYLQCKWRNGGGPSDTEPAPPVTGHPGSRETPQLPISHQIPGEPGPTAQEDTLKSHTVSSSHARPQFKGNRISAAHRGT